MFYSFMIAGFAGVGRASLGGPIQSRLLNGGVFRGGLFNQSELIGAIEYAIVLMALAAGAWKLLSWWDEYTGARSNYREVVTAYAKGKKFLSETNEKLALAMVDIEARNVSIRQKKSSFEKEVMVACKIIDAVHATEKAEAVTVSSKPKPKPQPQKKKGGGNKKKKGAAA